MATTTPIRSIAKTIDTPMPANLIVLDDGVSMGKAELGASVEAVANPLVDDKIAALDLGTASKEDVGAFATATQGGKADSAVQPDDLSPVATTGEYDDLSSKPTLGTAAAKDVGTGSSDVADNANVLATAKDGAWEQAAPAVVTRTIQDKLRENKTVLDFGAVGDCTEAGMGTDDAGPIQDALDWWKASPDRRLVFPDGFRWRVSDQTVADFGGDHAGKLVMRSPITPDPGVGDAMTIVNGLGGDLVLSVRGGGQDADYTQADPDDCDQAFVVRGMRGVGLDVSGVGYKGRVLRIPAKLSGERKCSFHTIRKLYTGLLIDGLDDVCGQAWYIDTGDSAFGQILSANPVWDKYGPVFEDVTDLTISHMEGGWRASSSGLEFRGCVSTWLGSIELGDETNTVDLVTFKNSAARPCNNILWDKLFLVGGARGLVMDSVGQLTTSSGSSTGAIIAGVMTRNNTLGIDMINCRDVVLNQNSYNDDQAYRETGSTSQRNIITSRSIGSKGTAFEIGTDAGANGEYRVTAISSNANNTASTPAILVSSTQPMQFNDPIVDAPNVSAAFDIPSGNAVRVFGGRINKNPAFTNLPSRARNIASYATEARGSATILSGSASVTVSHGLRSAAVSVQLTPGHAEARGAIAVSLGSTTFGIQVPSNVTADRTVYWEAKSAPAIG